MLVFNTATLLRMGDFLEGPCPSVYSDSSAARGICRRTGVGRIKHMQVRWMWVQESVRNKQLTIENIDTKQNTSDLGTKYLDLATRVMLIAMLPLRERLGSVVASIVSSVAMSQVGAIETWSTESEDGDEVTEDPSEHLGQQIGVVKDAKEPDSSWISYSDLWAMVAIVFTISSGVIWCRKRKDKDQDMSSSLAYQRFHQKAWLSLQRKERLEAIVKAAGLRLGSSRCTNEFLVDVLVEIGVKPIEELTWLKEEKDPSKHLLEDRNNYIALG